MANQPELSLVLLDVVFGLAYLGVVLTGLLGIVAYRAHRPRAPAEATRFLTLYLASAIGAVLIGLGTVAWIALASPPLWYLSTAIWAVVGAMLALERALQRRLGADWNPMRWLFDRV